MGMPPTTPKRTIGGIDTVRERVRREMAAKEWTVPELSRQMESNGCPIQPKSLYRVFDDEQPRTITADEMIAFSRVFDVSLDDLITPIALLDNDRAQELVKEFQDIANDLDSLIDRALTAEAELTHIARKEPALYAKVHEIAAGAAISARPMYDVKIPGKRRKITIADTQNLAEIRKAFDWGIRKEASHIVVVNDLGEIGEGRLIEPIDSEELR